MMIHAVIFDLDNTLYNYDSAHETAFGVLADYMRTTFGLTRDAFVRVHRRAMEEQRTRAGADCAAIHSRLIRYQIILETLGKPWYLADTMKLTYWTAFLSVMRPEPGVRECLNQLKENGLILGVGTNMTADYQFEKLERLELSPLFDFFVSSEEANSEKPERKLFDLCAAKAGVPPSECVFVGDSLAHDVRGALQAGMRAVWYQSGGTVSANVPENASWADNGSGPVPDGVPVLRSLPDLPALLRTFL